MNGDECVVCGDKFSESYEFAYDYTLHTMDLGKICIHDRTIYKHPEDPTR